MTKEKRWGKSENSNKKVPGRNMKQVMKKPDSFVSSKCRMTEEEVEDEGPMEWHMKLYVKDVIVLI